MGRIAQVRIGTLAEIKYPAFVPYDAGSPWLLASDAANLPQAANIVEAVALQLLEQHKPGEAQCVLYEAIKWTPVSRQKFS